MSLTRKQLEEIVAHGTGQQQIDAVALLEKMASREKAEADSSSDGTVRLRGFKGETYALPGCDPCHQNHPRRLFSCEHDIPPRVISKAFAEELDSHYKEFGGVQSGDAQSRAECEFIFGRLLATTDSELASWHSKFPTEPKEQGQHDNS